MTTPDVDPNVTPGQLPAEPQAAVAFCQQCGKALNADSRRNVGAAVFCEPCLQAKLSGAPTPTGPAGYAAWQTAPPLPPSTPNPNLAAVLGFIPGVGAMYNEQYAKGIAHLTIFALLVVLADVNGIFGLFIAGWEFYMAIEAYHTAVARRGGLPLPNPFGFNELGDRLGFPKGWTHPGTPATSSAPGPSGYHPQPDPPAEPWSPTPAAAWPLATAVSASHHYVPPAAPFSEPRPFTPPPASDAFTPVVPTPPIEPIATTPLQRIPVGAVLLILLGVLFLLSTTNIFHDFSPESLLGWAMIGLAAWLFLTRFAQPVTNSEAAGPWARLNRALQPSAWILTSGLLALLDAFHRLSWERSWPIFLITAGLLALLGRLATAERAPA